MTVNPKVQAATGAGAVSVLVVYIASLCGLDVPTEAAQSITVLVGLVAGYLKSA